VAKAFTRSPLSSWAVPPPRYGAFAGEPLSFGAERFTLEQVLRHSEAFGCVEHWPSIEATAIDGDQQLGWLCVAKRIGWSGLAVASASFNGRSQGSLGCTSPEASKRLTELMLSRCCWRILNRGPGI